MTVLRSVAMAFSMFSILPVPQVEWKKENMKYMLSALPLVGLVIGLAIAAWTMLCTRLGIGSLLSASGMALCPVLLSGGIHLDGFCDTVDALSSHAEPARKREILKDPSAGAFAVIYLGVYLLAMFGVCSELAGRKQAMFDVGLIYIFSRSMGAFAGTVFPGSQDTGLLAQFRDAAVKKAVFVDIVWCILCAGLFLWHAGAVGAAVVGIGILTLLGTGRMAKKEFGGMSGDLAGYLISLSELGMLFGLVIAERLVAVWF